MIIAVNTRLLLHDKLEGIGWFTFETLKRITIEHPEHQFIFIFDRPYCKDFIFSGNITPIILRPPARHPLLWYIWFEYQIPRILKKYKADLFLSPDGYLSLRTNIPQLAVIHDISFIHRTGDLPWLKSVYYNRYFPEFARKANRIATVSFYSKDDIVHSFGIDSEKIDVVYDGVNEFFKPLSGQDRRATRNKLSDGKEYFLFVGALHPRKNICGLLEAFDLFKRKKINETKLVIVGGDMHKTGEIFRFYKNMQFKNDVIFTGRVLASQLNSILGASLSLVFVPFFEGFGIPVIEAMRAGVPVICSDTTSLPEVGGDAVLYVDPYNPGEISDAMDEISTNSQVRNNLIEKGFEQMKKFSWERTSGLLWRSIEKVIQ